MESFSLYKCWSVLTTFSKLLTESLPSFPGSFEFAEIQIDGLKRELKASQNIVSFYLAKKTRKNQCVCTCEG